MGLNDELATCAVRVSMGVTTTDEEIQRFADAWLPHTRGCGRGPPERNKMTNLDTDVREGVDRETVEAVQSLSGKYKHGWETEIEMEYAPKGAEPRYRAADLGSRTKSLSG